MDEYYASNTWDLNGLCRLFLGLFTVIVTSVFLSHRGEGGGAMASRRPAEGTQRWLQDGLPQLLRADTSATKSDAFVHGLFEFNQVADQQACFLGAKSTIMHCQQSERQCFTRHYLKWGSENLSRISTKHFRYRTTEHIQRCTYTLDMCWACEDAQNPSSW